jgi:hypothetical protein
MSSAELRDRVKEYIDQLSPERLLVAADFLAYLTERESEEATQELLDIPGFLAAFERGKKEAEAGKVTPVENLRRKY